MMKFSKLLSYKCISEQFAKNEIDLKKLMSNNRVLKNWQITEAELNLEIFNYEYDIDVIIIDLLLVKSFERIDLNLPITLKVLVV